MALMVMVLAVVCSFIPAVTPSGDLLKLQCDPAVGLAAQTTVIPCRFRDFNEDVKMVSVSLKKMGKNETSFRLIVANNQVSGDPRISLENPAKGPSLKITGTMFSDMGSYEYRVLTNKGQASGKFSINVTAKYKDPTGSTWPENVTEGGSLDLYCNATEGYPAGTIHWFDRYGTNWTVNSILTKTINDNKNSKSVALISKLSFKTIDSSLAPFSCIVLNSKYNKEGEKTFQIMPAKQDSDKMEGSQSNKTIIAGVMVIGSLIVGLLFALLFCRRRRFQQGYNSDQAGISCPISNII